jgi:hypothetical protein
VQTAYGDSGKTTFFIDDESGWKRHRRDIRGNEVKVMRRINNVRSPSKPSSRAAARLSARSCPS